MAILSKKDPLGRDSDWWKVRTKTAILATFRITILRS